MNKEDRLNLYDWYNPATDDLQCLICSKWMKMIPPHLRTHQISSSSYREEFDIYRTTPLCSKLSIRARRENMVAMRLSGKAVVSARGVEPPQLVGKESNSLGFIRKDYKEFDHVRVATSLRHKGKVLSKETRKKLSKSLKGKDAWNKTEPVTRKCQLCATSFTCMQWQPNKFCSKKCAMLSNKNWLKRKVLISRVTPN